MIRLSLSHLPERRVGQPTVTGHEGSTVQARVCRFRTVPVAGTWPLPLTVTGAWGRAAHSQSDGMRCRLCRLAASNPSCDSLSLTGPWGQAAHSIRAHVDCAGVLPPISSLPCHLLLGRYRRHANSEHDKDTNGLLKLVYHCSVARIFVFYCPV